MVGAFGGARWCALGVVFVHGCISEPLDGSPGCTVGQGDLVITEVHANPDGSDGDSEYLEIHNATDAPIDLIGMTLAASRGDDSGSEEHRFTNAIIGPGDYLVVGNATSAELPQHIDYSYGTSLGALRNSDAALSLWCGMLLVDDVRYASTRDGQALEFDGAEEPSAEQNDDPEQWCDAPRDGQASFEGNFGSPGSRNASCTEPALPISCIRADGTEPARPTADNAFIEEWMPNASGPDDDLEWVELAFLAPVNLAGVRLGTGVDALGPSPFESCHPVDAGSRVVLGASPWAAPRVDADLNIGLGNTGLRELVLAMGDDVLDRVTYLDTIEGAAWQVDEDGEVCRVMPSPGIEYLDGNFGTPGEPNPPCPLELAPGMCLDGGVPRDIEVPLPGTIRITEWLASPSRADSRAGEWVEVRVESAADLNGLTWVDRSGRGSPLESDECLSVDPGALLVFARSDDAEANGGLPFVDFTLDISLNNRDETIALEVAGIPLEEVSYEGSSPGAATQRDDFGGVCDAVAAFGDGDFGTPGEPNPVCG
ncbi:MAG: lamin tail domain-containing protein [Myxococcota bacterium]